MAELPPTEKALSEALRNAKKPAPLRASEAFAEASQAGPDTNPRNLSPLAQIADAKARQAAQMMAQQQAEKQLQAERLKQMGITDLSVVWGEKPTTQQDQARPQGKQGRKKPDKFARLKAKARQRLAQNNAFDSLVERYMLHSRTPVATLQPGVIPAADLNITASSTKGIPMGIDLKNLSPKERQTVLSRIPLERQEQLARAWEERMKRGF